MTENENPAAEGDQPPSPPAERSQLTCPRCGSARSKAATFCGICGQDLRPGAMVTPLPPPPEPAAKAKDTEGGGRRMGLPLGRSKSSAAAGAAATAAGAAATAPKPTMPGATTKPTPKPPPAVVPKETSTLSFSERYRGTEFSNPDIERFLPPKSGSGSGRGRTVAAGLLVVGLVVAAVAGVWVFVIAPGSSPGPNAAASTAADAGSPTPRPTPTPIPTINGQLPDDVEVAACLMLFEEAGQQALVVAVRDDVAAGELAAVPAIVDEIAASVDVSRSSLPTLRSQPETDELAKAFAAHYEAQLKALTAVKAAAETGVGKGMKKAIRALNASEADRTTLLETHAALVKAFPEADCVVEIEE